MGIINFNLFQILQMSNGVYDAAIAEMNEAYSGLGYPCSYSDLGCSPPNRCAKKALVTDATDDEFVDSNVGECKADDVCDVAQDGATATVNGSETQYWLCAELGEEKEITVEVDGARFLVASAVAAIALASQL